MKVNHDIMVSVPLLMVPIPLSNSVLNVDCRQTDEAMPSRDAKSVGIRDVARAAGVSTTTVSRVLAGSEKVTEKTRNQVLVVIQNLGYFPSGIARSLKSKSTALIGVLVSDIINPFSTAVVRGIEDAVQENEISLILCNTDENEEKMNRYLHLLLTKRVDGLILAPTGNATPIVATARSKGIPIILIDRLAKGITLPFVGVDNVLAAERAVTHLLDDGHRRIGVVTGLSNISTTVERVEGYRRALRNLGLQVDPRLIHEGYGRTIGGEEAAQRHLAIRPRPTAIFVTNNLMTLGVLKALSKLGIRCPDEVSVIGFDDHEWASMFSPPITVIAQPVYEIGRTAADFLVRAMSGERIPCERTLLETQLIIRGSCRPGGHPESQSAA